MIDITKHIQKAKQVHGDYYDYSLITDPNISYKDKVPIICPEHGVFEQMFNSHHKGFGCPECGKRDRANKRTNDIAQQIKKCNQIHEHKYDYSLILDNPRAQQKIDIVCPDHGVFKQKLNDHLNGSGCPVCATEQRARKNRLKIKQTHQKRLQTQKQKYGCEYNQRHISSDALQCLTDKQWLCDQHYNKQQSLITISKQLGVSDRLVGKYLQSHGLKTQLFAVSNQELQLRNFVASLDVTCVYNQRDIIHPYELDIFLPDHNIAIEYCGLYWHSETRGKHRLYHKRKHDMCSEQGIQLLTIFEDEWVKKPQIVMNKIRSLLHKHNQQTVYARNTHITTISQKQKRDFYNENHIQGNGPGSITYALMYNERIVACCSFSRKKGEQYYLTRYATNCHVIGGFSKLVKHFINNHRVDSLISFADLRWSDGRLYEKAGWNLDKHIPPDYYYVTNGVNREHKFNFRRKFLPKKLAHFDPNLSEKENCDNNGLLRIWDCGKLRYVLEC